MFPALGTKNERRNGGVPQEGNLTKHLEIYQMHINELVPDVNNNGLIIIDFESWRPIFRQNFGSLVPYKDLSYKIERERHPFWIKSRQEKEVWEFFRTSRTDSHFIQNFHLSCRLRRDLKALEESSLKKLWSFRRICVRMRSGDTTPSLTASGRACKTTAVPM